MLGKKSRNNEIKKYSFGSGKEKVKYNTKASESLSKKHGVHFSNYKCVFCDGYHIGKNRDNKKD